MPVSMFDDTLHNKAVEWLDNAAEEKSNYEAYSLHKLQSDT
jgi:hypothetical protein